MFSGTDVDVRVTEILALDGDASSILRASELFWELEVRYSAPEYLLLLVWVLKLLANVGPALKEEAFCSTILEFPAAEKEWGGRCIDPLDHLSNNSLISLKDCALGVLAHNLERIRDFNGLYSGDDVFEYETGRLTKAIEEKIAERKTSSS